jgi:putative permease
MTKHIIQIGAAVLTTLLALLVLWQFREALVYVLISLALAAALRPLFKRLDGRSFVFRAAWILVYLAVLGGFGFLVVIACGNAINELQQLVQSVSAQDAWRLPGWLQGSPLQTTLVAWLPQPSKLFEAFTGDQGQLVLPAMLGFSQGLGTLVSGLLVILFLSIYWSINQIHFERLWLSLLPSEQRKQARDVWRTIEPNLGRYIRSEVVQSILAGLLLGLVYWLLGSPYPTLMALIGALAWLVPVVGAPLAVILPLVLGLLTSVQFSLLAALITLIVLIVMEVWLEPRLFKRTWDNPILTFVMILALSEVFGLAGILIAPPVSVVCQILWNRLVSRRAVSGAAVQVSDLKERQARLWVTLKAMHEPPLPLVTSSMEQLAILIGKAEPLLDAGLPVEPSGPFPMLPSIPVAEEAHVSKKS